MRASRLLTILMILQTRGRTSAETLAEELEVSVRTVYRDIHFMQALGLPIEGEAGVGYLLRQKPQRQDREADHA